MSERKTLSITQVNEIQKVGDKQIPKLSFKANDGDKELTYFTFKSSLFEFIKEGQAISADVETSSREWDGQIYTDRRIVQLYVDGQPIVGKRGDGYRGKSPEELEQQARLMILAYAKDLAVAQIIPLERITTQADIFYKWVKPLPIQSPKESLGTQEPQRESAFPEKTENSPTGKRVQNITELKSLLMKHKIATHEAYEALSIKAFTDLVDLDEAWEKIKEAKGIE